MHDDPVLRPAIEKWARATEVPLADAWFMSDKRYARTARDQRTLNRLADLKVAINGNQPIEPSPLEATVVSSPTPKTREVRPPALPEAPTPVGPKMMTPAQVEAMYKDFSAAQLPPGARVNFKDWAIPAGSKCANKRTAKVGDVEVECSPCVDHGDPGVTHLGSYELESVSTWRAYYAVNLGYKLRLGGGEQAITLSCGPESAMSTTPALINALAAFGITMEFPFTKAAELRQAPAQPATTAF